MKLNTAMLARSIRRALHGGWADFMMAAQSRDVLHPAETGRIRPAIYADGALERITGLSPWCNWDTEMRSVKGGQVDHAATEAFTFDDVRIAGPFLYLGPARTRHGHGPERLFLKNVAFQDLDAVHLVTNWTGADFFGQYLSDLLPLELIPPADAAKIHMTTRHYAHAPGYRALFGLEALPIVDHGRARNLTLYRDFSQNSFKRTRYDALRARLRRRVPTRPDRPPGIYLRRGATGERRILANETEIEARLTALGFDIVVPAELGADDIARRTADAPIVIGVEGSHLSHGIFSVADTGAFLVLQPPDRFAMAYKEIADCLDLHFAFIVGTHAEDGFTVDPDELERMIETLERRLSVHPG